MPRRPLGLALLCLLALLPLTAACGRDDGVEEALIIGDSLTVYSSQPLQGPLADVSRDIVRAEKLALRDAGGRAGVFNVNFVSLDSADPETGRWDPGRVAGNARRAVQTPNTIAYLGELESGASAVSLPILNEGGLLQVSPRDTFAGLTERGGRGEPEKYYPSGVRNFARLVPPSDDEARLLVRGMDEQDVRRLVVADDRSLAGTGLGDRMVRQAEAAGIEVVDRWRLDSAGEVPESLAEELRERRPDALFYAGAYSDFAVDLLRDAHAADADLRLFGADALALAPELPERAGAAADRLQVTAIVPGEDADFIRRFTAAYGERPDEQAVLGYRAMQLVLAAIDATGEDAASRRAVLRRAVGQARRPRARFARYRVVGTQVVRVGPPM